MSDPVLGFEHDDARALLPTSQIAISRGHDPHSVTATKEKT
jgi:hypothetical protein